MTNEISLVVMFVAGFLAGGHCLVMCGGIGQIIGYAGGCQVNFWRILIYNIGRILGYVTLGAILGLIGKSLFGLGAGQTMRLVLEILASGVLIAMGIYITGFTQIFIPLEKIGSPLWRTIEPITRKFLPPKNQTQALILGYLWGFLPCGIVYGALIKAFSTTDILYGALMMLAFGLGTLPNLILISWGFAFLSKWRTQIWFRLCSGFMLIAFGVMGLMRIPMLEEKINSLI